MLIKSVLPQSPSPKFQAPSARFLIQGVDPGSAFQQALCETDAGNQHSTPSSGEMRPGSAFPAMHQLQTKHPLKAIN